MGASQFSPWVVAQSADPKWRPGEQLAATAFTAVTLYLFFDVNVAIFRTFRKRKGLYFWSMIFGIWGCLINSIGVILRFMIPNSIRFWPAYTLFLTLGWTIFAPAQLLVLFSRLHIVVNKDSRLRRLRRVLLIMILSTFVTLIMPTWVTVWPAFNPDPKISSVWSPRDAIVERYTQIGFTLLEALISGIYIRALCRGLREIEYEATICERRVMWDLIYVNVIGLLLDMVNIIFLYLNQSGISHPVQSFSYALKLKLEFIVLNQLLEVATRGRGKFAWEHSRYRRRRPELRNCPLIKIKDETPLHFPSLKEAGGFGKSEFNFTTSPDDSINTAKDQSYQKSVNLGGFESQTRVVRDESLHNLETNRHQGISGPVVKVYDLGVDSDEISPAPPLVDTASKYKPCPSRPLDANPEIINDAATANQPIEDFCGNDTIRRTDSSHSRVYDRHKQVQVSHEIPDHAKRGKGKLSMRSEDQDVQSNYASLTSSSDSNTQENVSIGWSKKFESYDWFEDGGVEVFSSSRPRKENDGHSV